MAKEKSAKKKESKEIVISQSLAVKYRPRKFKDLVGQDPVVTVIKGMFKTRKFPGAILIEGQTGGGKTTTARMLFAYLNCETYNACGKCASCQMGVESHPDLQVVNAGTDGGVDAMRKLVKSANLSPLFNKRVICVDEAHKLTGASAEALLVPLEEPSRDTIWILCTTEPEGLKATLKNRCVRLVMRTIPKAQIIERLMTVAEQEGTNLAKIKGSKEALEMIADFTNGSMREALALLETVLFGIQGGGDISDKTVLTAYVQNSEVDLDKASANFVALMLANKFSAAVGVLRTTENMRGFLSKSLWLADNLVGRHTKTNKFQSYTVRLFDEVCKKNGYEQPKFAAVMKLLRVLVEANQDFNRSTVQESFILHASIEKYAQE